MFLSLLIILMVLIEAGLKVTQLKKDGDYLVVVFLCIISSLIVSGVGYAIEEERIKRQESQYKKRV